MKKFYPTPFQKQVLDLFDSKDTWTTEEIREKTGLKSIMLGAALSSLSRSRQIEIVGRENNINWIYKKINNKV